MHGDFMKENISVYEALREHILHKEDQIANETIYMYVTYFALLTIGSIWSDWISLASFIDLIVFQSMINGDQWSVTKASMYIKVFFETKRNDIHWELLHQDTKYKSAFSKSIRKTIGWYIYKNGATLLSIFSLFSISVSMLHTADYKICAIHPVLIVRLILAIILCIITIHVNRQYFHLRDGLKSNDNLSETIDDFYKRLEEASTLDNMDIKHHSKHSTIHSQKMGNIKSSKSHQV